MVESGLFDEIVIVGTCRQFGARLWRCRRTLKEFSWLGRFISNCRNRCNDQDEKNKKGKGRYHLWCCRCHDTSRLYIIEYQQLAPIQREWGILNTAPILWPRQWDNMIWEFPCAKPANVAALCSFSRTSTSTDPICFAWLYASGKLCHKMVNACLAAASEKSFRHVDR